MSLDQGYDRDEVHDAGWQDVLEAARLRAEELRRRAEAAIARAEEVLAATDAERPATTRLQALTDEVAGLRRAMESRAVIEQAKGILIASTGCDADRAFLLLQRQSQHENRKLRDVAIELVASKVRSRPTTAAR